MLRKLALPAVLVLALVPAVDVAAKSKSKGPKVGSYTCTSKQGSGGQIPLKIKKHKGYSGHLSGEPTTSGKYSVSGKNIKFKTGPYADRFRGKKSGAKIRLFHADDPANTIDPQFTCVKNK
jgi:hypothetical protein